MVFLTLSVGDMGKLCVNDGLKTSSQRQFAPVFLGSLKQNKEFSGVQRM